MEDRAGARRCAVLLSVVYGALALLILTEKPGLTTNDTRIELTEDPGGYLATTFTLWNPQVSLGELQNQAYGYLFPQGSWFLVLDQTGVPAWVSQRLWSALVLLVACEGARRLARQLVGSPWAAAAAGLAYGLAPRHLTELTVRSAEILPGAVLPWALLPIVQAVEGRRRPRDAAVLSAAAYACSGGVNGTATAAPLGLLVVVVGWAVWRRHLGWRFALGWGALIAAVSFWWAFSLLRLGAYSPPFFDFVEDARTTTATSGFAAALRGASNWVGYLTVGGEPWWPAGYTVSYQPWVVLGTGVLALLGLLGLLRYQGRFRAPLLLAAGLGLACQVIAHTGPLDGPVSGWFQELLDGPLVPLRNVPKADPVLRVPLAVGLGGLVDDLVRHLAGRLALRRAGARRQRGRGRRAATRAGAVTALAAGLALAVAGGLLAAAAPIVQAQTRTPGWERMPRYWHQAADFVADAHDRATGGTGTTWVIPGSGFAIQQWGWTMEEPMQAVADSPWFTRNQVPLAPPPTIRLMATLEGYLETGSGSPYLRAMLSRLGVATVLVRHDLDLDVTGATPSSMVAVALARSPGIERVATLGQLEFGPAIEVFRVRRSSRAVTTGGYDVRDLADAVTVASSVEDAVAAVGAGLVTRAEPMLVPGTAGWEPGRPADVVGDGFRRRERSFGRIHDSESAVMTADEPYRAGRAVPNYPGPEGADPVVARYVGIADVDASGSAAWADVLGPLRPEAAPWSALDGDRSTYWQPRPLESAEGQWVEIDLGGARRVSTIELQEPGAIGLRGVRRWRVVTDGTVQTAEPDPDTGRAVVRLPDHSTRTVRIVVDEVDDPRDAIGLAEVEIGGVVPRRTLVLPPVPLEPGADLVFSARPESRACVTTLLGPDCDPGRRRPAEEATALDRTFTLQHPGRWQVAGLAVARSRPGTAELLHPYGRRPVVASSWLGEDPTVSPRMAYDGEPTTSWVADPRDEQPSLTLDLGEERTLRRLTVRAPAGIAALPRSAVITAGKQERQVDLRGTGRFRPLRTRFLTVTFEPTEGDRRPVGVAELRLAGAGLTEPLDGSQPTGAVCGLGPLLVVDGRAIETRVEGNLGAVVSAGQLGVRPCGLGARERVRLGAGEHRVRLAATEQFQPVGLTLVDHRRERQRAERSRTLDLVAVSDTRVVLDIGPGEEALISAPHNQNAGWVATLDGEELEPVVVDGWAQGWRLPAEAAGEVELRFAPQEGYLIGLVGGLVLLGSVLLWALLILGVGLVRRTGRAAAGPAGADVPLPHPARGQTGRPGARRWRSTTMHRVAVPVLVTAAGLAGWVVGGPLAAAGAGAGVLLARWPRLVDVLVGLALAVALAIWVVLSADEHRRPPASVDLVTAAAVGLGFGASVRSGGTGARPPADGSGTPGEAAA